MLAAGVFVFGTALAASLLQTQSTNLVLLGAVLVGGIFAWRSRRGDFYKAVAEEKNDENRDLKRERDRLRAATDITPIMETLSQVVQALDRHAKLTEQVFEKVADMNGSLRAHGEAMKALADHLILDEAARGLLKAAAQAPTAAHRRLRGTQ
jgi:hypothetical protein